MLTTYTTYETSLYTIQLSLYNSWLSEVTHVCVRHIYLHIGVGTNRSSNFNDLSSYFNEFCIESKWIELVKRKFMWISNTIKRSLFKPQMYILIYVEVVSGYTKRWRKRKEAVFLTHTSVYFFDIKLQT